MKLVMENFHVKDLSSNKEPLSRAMKDKMQGSEESGEIRPFPKLAENKIDERINPS